MNFNAEVRGDIDQRFVLDTNIKEASNAKKIDLGNPVQRRNRGYGPISHSKGACHVEGCL